MFETLQTAWHMIATVFGISISKYGRFVWPPMQGIGQGNGAGPAMWVVSCVIIQDLHIHGHSSNHLSALSLTLVSIVYFTFVDDTDVIHSRDCTRSTGEEISIEMQEVVDCWEGLL